jgi:hypothetical protein
MRTWSRRAAVSVNRHLLAALDIHASAAQRFSNSAAAIAADRWLQPVAEGKWSPALIASHLIQTYDIVLSELRGGPGMQIRTSRLMRLALRIVLVPRLLGGGAFPDGARAPKETRPPADPPEQRAAIERFDRMARELDAAARSATPAQRITHAYFGAYSVARGVLLCARHIEHHEAKMKGTTR